MALIHKMASFLLSEKSGWKINKKWNYLSVNTAMENQETGMEGE